MRKQWLTLALIALLALLVACGGSDGAAVTPTTALTLKPTFTPIPTATTEAPQPETGSTVEPTAISATVEGQTEGETGSEQETGQPTPEPTTPPTTTPDFMDVMTSPDYGMQAFMWWRPEVAHRDLGLIRDAGFRWVKQDFAWREIEGAAKGAFDWSRPDRIVERAHDGFGLKILARVDRQPGWANPNCTGGGEMGPPQNMQDYADFLYAMASRYKGRIAAYSIWNEPNLAREWCNQPPNPAEYVEMLRVAYNAIKSADPNAIVISAGLSPTGGPMPVAMNDVEYLRGMYEAMGGNSQGYFDMLGAHAPGFKAPPEVSPDEVEANPDLYGRGRWFTFRRVEDLRAVMEEYGDGNRRVAILEMGWTTDPRPDSPYNWHAVTPEQQADYLVRAYQFAKENWRPWIGVMSLIYVCNYDWTPEDEQYYWCITEPTYPETVVRPAYEALKAMPKD